ncbi:hypothetical protein [Actinomyces faecalis]|uniref:hypothetical protein n=1 Tax=Actinomyces faecalis TaxID=2722820 RepID=UPI001555B9A0|nr:hypothetical protein [Actinomyces faecalis]
MTLIPRILPARTPREQTWPRPLATWSQVTRELCGRELITAGVVELVLVLISLGLAAARHTPMAQTLVGLSHWLMLLGCLLTGRAAGFLRTALGTGLPRRTALGAGAGIIVCYTVVQLPWILLTTVTALTSPGTADAGPLTPWSVLGWVLACVGANAFVLTFMMLHGGVRHASWSWALLGLVILVVAGSMLTGPTELTVVGPGASTRALLGFHTFLPSLALVFAPWSAGLVSWGWSLLLGPLLAWRAVLRWEPRG